MPHFIVGDSDTELTADNINSSISHPGVDLSILTASVSDGTATRVSGDIILSSYLTSDEGLRLGCSIDYISGGILDIKKFIETLQLTQAGLYELSHRHR